MNNIFKPATLKVIGIIFIAFTLLIYFFQSFEKTLVSLGALIFIIIAEIITFFGILFIAKLEQGHSKVFVLSGMSSTLFIYLVATIISSYLSIIFSLKLFTFLFIELFIISLTAIVSALILYFSNRIYKVDQKLMNERKMMQICERRIFTLLSDNKNKSFEKQLTNLYETIKYGDKIGISSVDENIVLQISLLENALQSSKRDTEEVTNLINDISTFLSQRNIEIAELKRGAF